METDGEGADADDGTGVGLESIYTVGGFRQENRLQSTESR